jgi:hypothetical protein
VANSDTPEWKKKALADPSLGERQVQVLLHGPKSLTDAWFLQAMKFKYGTPRQ